MEYRSLPVPAGLVGLRVDAGLAQLLGFSRTFAAQVVAQGGVKISGVLASKSDRLFPDQWIEISWEPPRKLDIEPALVPGLEIIFNDEHIIVVNKPAGVAAHPSPGWSGLTVVGGLAASGYRIATSGAAERQGIVHRLDVGTSGLMVVAKSEHAYTSMKRAFHDREVKKTYHTVVQGHPDPLAGTIEAPVGRHPHSEWRFAVVADGKPAITHYRTIEAFPHASLLEINLETGRTHQIRVHMAAQRHPCVGDTMYGADPKLSEKLGLARQWLHAKQLAFIHPANNNWVEFESAYSDDLADAISLLAKGA